MPGIVICGEGLNDLYYDELGGQSGPLKICLDKLLEFFWDDASYINFFQYPGPSWLTLRRANQKKEPLLFVV